MACDARGRVYVSDYVNDRIQVYSPEGAFLKTIPVAKPASVQIHPKTQDIWAFSYGIAVADHGADQSAPQRYISWKDLDIAKIKPSVTCLGPLEKPAVRFRQTLPIPPSFLGNGNPRASYVVTLDGYAEPPRIWNCVRKLRHEFASFPVPGPSYDKNEDVCMMVQEGDQWVVKKKFFAEAANEVARAKPHVAGIERLYVNPKTGRLYVLEFFGFWKECDELIEIDPESGRIRLLKLPMKVEDLCFDWEGNVCLRYVCASCVDPETWAKCPGTTANCSTNGRASPGAGEQSRMRGPGRVVHFHARRPDHRLPFHGDHGRAHRWKLADHGQ